MKHSTSKPTANQRIRLEAIKSLPCVACQKENIQQPLATEVHHIVDKGYRSHSGGHDATIPLCSYIIAANCSILSQVEKCVNFTAHRLHLRSEILSRSMDLKEIC